MILATFCQKEQHRESGANTKVAPSVVARNSPDVFMITPREKEVIESIIMGKGNKEIGKSLFISIQTVKNIDCKLYKNRYKESHAAH